MSYYATEDSKQFLDELAKQGECAAWFCIRISDERLTGDHKTPAQQERETQRLSEGIQKRQEECKFNFEETKPDKKNVAIASATSIPFFDINFEAILKKKFGSIDELISLEIVDKNLELFKKLFGIDKSAQSIEELKNQSSEPLGNPR